MDSAFDYATAFSINQGIISTGDQEKIKNAKVTIVGVGGAGGSIAIMLARTGIEHFTLVDFDTYSPSNLNRQIGCRIDTLGRLKVEVMKEDILKINPLADIKTISEKVPLSDFNRIIENADVYFSEADDLAYSTDTLIRCQAAGKMAISLMPYGMGSAIMVFPPQNKIYDPTDLMGGPKGLSYDELKEFQTNEITRMGRRWHIIDGKMRISWFKKWCRGDVGLTQLCPAVWAGASIAATEAIKFIIGKWELVRAPYIWFVSLAENKIKVQKYRRRTWLFNKAMYRAFHIKFMNIGKKLEKSTLTTLSKELDRMEAEEAEGKTPKIPFMWKHLI